MKKVLKYTGITFAVLIALGILGNILGVETAQPESEQAKAEQQAEKEEEQAAKEAEKLAEEQAKAEEEAAKQAEKEAEKLAKEQAKAEEEAAKQAEKLAKEQAKAEEEAAKQVEKEAAEAAKRAEEDKKAAEQAAANSWESKIAELAKNADRPADKFYALETYMMGYSYSAKEVEQFKADIIADYTSGTYLSDITNDERMLTNIFKGYIVEKGSSNAAVKDFAFDYFQNMKYTYRGVDAVDSDAVKANESQMNRALSQM